MMNLRNSLLVKYQSYTEQGHVAFAVTLSTYVKSETIAKSHRMADFWDNHFLHRIKRSLPMKLKTQFDHDFIVEKSPDGFFHYHGLLAFTKEAARKFWISGELKAQIRRDLESFRHEGEYRPFCVNKFLIEPIRQGQVGAWIRYITKENEIPTSSSH